MKNWKPPTQDDPVPDPHSFILDCGKENSSLAHACLHLARRNLSLDIHRVVKLLEQSNGLLYAHQHWFKHFDDAGCGFIPSLENLSDAMRVAYGRLRRYAREMTLANVEAVALIERLRDTAEFASQCINQNFGKLIRSSREIG